MQLHIVGPKLEAAFERRRVVGRDVIAVERHRRRPRPFAERSDDREKDDQQGQ